MTYLKYEVNNNQTNWHLVIILALRQTCITWVGYAYTAKTLVLNIQHQAGVKLAVLIFGVGLTPLGVNTKSKTARFGTFL